MDPAKAQTALRPVARVMGTFFFGLFLAAGVFFLILIGRTFLSVAEAYRWDLAEATILESQIGEAGPGRTEPVLRVRYRYAYSGQLYESERYDPDSLEHASRDAYQLAERYSAGSVHRCYVNPKEPATAVLSRGNPWLGLFALVPLVFVAIGAIGIYSCWRGARSVAPTPMSAAPSAGIGRRRGGLLLFGCFAVMGGAGTAFLLLRPLQQSLAARQWVETPCEIVSSQVRTHSSSDGDTYWVEIVYRYTVDGRVYRSNRYDFSVGSSSGFEGKAETVRRYPEGSRAVCYVNPRDATEAVIQRGLGVELAFGLIPFGFLVIGVAGLVWTSRTPAGTGPLGHRPHAPPGTRASATGISRAGLQTPTPLTPKTSRAAKLLGLVLVSLFWNGIVSVFVVHVVGEWRRGNGSWFLTLFMLPFVLIGLAMIGGIAHQFLALFNPRARLTIGGEAVRLGEPLDLSWEFEGRLGRLRRISLVLEAREEATYRRGTDTKTDRAVFLELPVFDSNLSTLEPAGRARIIIPPDTMHSFKSTNNQVVWSLKLKGNIPHWPDIDDEYPILVLPKASVS